MSDLENRKKAILNNPDRVVCSVYGNANISKVDCLQRYKNAIGWKQNNNPKSPGFEGARLNKAGALDINCQKCEQGKKLLIEQQNKPKEKLSNKPIITDKKFLDIPEGFIPFSKCKRIYEKPFVYCYGGRMIIFNSSACETFGIKDFKSVEPYFDPKKQTLGFRFFKEVHTKHTYSLTHNKASSSFCSREFQARFQIKNFERTLLERLDGYENFYIAKLETE